MHSNNLGAVAVVNSGYSKVPKVMNLQRCLFFIQVHLTSQCGQCMAQNGWADATVHDTEILTFSADDRAENPHISAWTISGFRADT